MITILETCPDRVPWCTAHELLVDHVVDPPDIHNHHQTRMVSIQTTSPGVPYRALGGHLGGTGDGLIATLQAFKGSIDRPMIAVGINSSTSGSPDTLWTTAAEARDIAAELVRVADLIDLGVES